MIGSHQHAAMGCTRREEMRKCHTTDRLLLLLVHTGRAGIFFYTPLCLLHVRDRNRIVIAQTQLVLTCHDHPGRIIVCYSTTEVIPNSAPNSVSDSSAFSTVAAP